MSDNHLEQQMAKSVTTKSDSEDELNKSDVSILLYTISIVLSASVRFVISRSEL